VESEPDSGTEDVGRVLVDLAVTRLEAVADPEKAGPMAAYMKTEMPFHGVPQAGRTPIMKELVRTYPPTDNDDYRANVRALWDLPHREEKYLALGYARAFRDHHTPANLDLFLELVVEGAWWDFVDEIASKLVGGVLLRHRAETTPTIDSLVGDDDMWLRRTAIICQLNHKIETDTGLLARACTVNLADPEFFIRKAIGWALREYAKTDPDWVRSFVRDREHTMSRLSLREATKHL